MKKSDILGAINAGKIVAVGKFLDFKKEVVAYRDKPTGKPATFNKLEYCVKVAAGVVFVQPDTRKIPDFNMEAFKCTLQPMDEVLVEIHSMQTERGITTIGGTVSKLEA